MKYLFFLMALLNIFSCHSNGAAPLPSHDFRVVNAVAAPDGGTMYLTINSENRIYDIGVYQPPERKGFQCYISQVDKFLYKVSEKDEDNVILDLLREWLISNNVTTNQIMDISHGNIPAALEHEQHLVAELFYECSNLGLLD